MVNILSAMQETQVRSLDREDPLEEEIAIYSSILAGESPGQRSLAGYSLWSNEELDMTEQLTLSLFFSQARYSVVSQAFSGHETL